MPEMFGVSDAEVALRPNYMQKLQAQEIMGRIAMQPAQMRGEEARAAEHEATAATMQDALQRSRMLRELSQRALAGGRIATMQDANDVMTDRSPAADLERIYNQGLKEGMSPLDLAKISEQTAELRAKDATTKNARSNQQVHELQAVELKAKRLGSLAMAGLSGPQAYATLRMQTDELNHLPQTWEAARPFLENLATASVSTQAQIDQTRKAARNEDLERATRAAIAVALARADKTRVDADLARQRYDVNKKNGGAGDPATVALKKANTKKAEAATEAQRLKTAPMIPVEDQRIVGQIYTLPGGKRRVQWVEDPDTGEVGAIPYTGE